MILIQSLTLVAITELVMLGSVALVYLMLCAAPKSDLE
jgi:hypothetical protein